MAQVVQHSPVCSEGDEDSKQSSNRRIRAQTAGGLNSSFDYAADPSPDHKFQQRKVNVVFFKRSWRSTHAKAIGTSNSSPGSVVGVFE